jgi:hypothetical protein
LLSGIVPRKYGVVEVYDPDEVTPYHWLVRWADGTTDWMYEDGIVMQDLIYPAGSDG